MCIDPINPQIAKLLRNLRTSWYIFGLSNSKKNGIFQDLEDQHSDPTITLLLESPPPLGVGGPVSFLCYMLLL